MEKCPNCGSKNIETYQDEVDIGVGILYGPLTWRCHDCSSDNCSNEESNGECNGL